MAALSVERPVTSYMALFTSPQAGIERSQVSRVDSSKPLPLVKPPTDLMLPISTFSIYISLNTPVQ